MNRWFAEPRREWLIAALALLGALLLVTVGRGTPTPPTGSVRFDVTVVPGEIDHLDCASDAAVEGYRCAFDAKGTRVDVQKPLRPYVGIDEELLLISGAFEAPAVVKWLKQARRKETRRVTLRCRGTWLGRSASVGVRLRRTDAFVTHGDLAVVAARHCSVRP